MHSTLYLCVRTCRRCERRGPTAACVSCVPALHPAPHAAPPPPHTSPPHTALRRTHAHSALLHSGPSHSYNYSETMLTMERFLPESLRARRHPHNRQTGEAGILGGSPDMKLASCWLLLWVDECIRADSIFSLTLHSILELPRVSLGEDSPSTNHRYRTIWLGTRGSETQKPPVFASSRVLNADGEI